MDAKILANLLLQTIWMVKPRHLKGKTLADCHGFIKFANIFPLQIFPHRVLIQLLSNLFVSNFNKNASIIISINTRAIAQHNSYLYIRIVHISLVQCANCCIKLPLTQSTVGTFLDISAITASKSNTICTFYYRPKI